ncbi:phosphoribosyl 1,2-cyclic phosphate phosphodiesterase [Belliella buryatensis]|uniref:Phosphoribosyl 1,2-cyclic phosphate phosphodiesterase n=1 Tax=Belliella buryatensis TaxID=1500549 RepID=A0A239CNS2_9BACT|nr:MBL fold metallo-hydrolase [Belliella buryatensis]SNS21805.1 phosphoribosyl 1,2-cyclic phosphate phosphodiesterase [Belliella buryatensis]
MRVTFLGTGTSQGVPVIGCNCPVCASLDFRDKRLRSSIHIEIEGKSLVIDTGPDFRAQMLREQFNKLDAVIFTHEHKDHTAGLDDIRPFNFMQKKDMPVYATTKVLNQIKREFSYIFEEVKYPGVPQVMAKTISKEKIFEVEGVKIQPIEVMHYRLPVLGFRIGDFTYITDAKTIAPRELEKIKGSKVLVLNALQLNHHISHFTLEEAVAMVELLKPEKAYFTHISHKLGTHADVEKQLPDHIRLAFDGLKIDIA